MINIRLKPEEFPFKLIKRLLIRFVTPEVSQNMLNAKLNWLRTLVIKETFPLLYSFTSFNSHGQTGQIKTFTYCTQQSQYRSDDVCQLTTNFSNQGFSAKQHKRESD